MKMSWEIYSLLTEEQVLYLELLYGKRIDIEDSTPIRETEEEFNSTIIINDYDANFIIDNFNSAF
jgi:hypothetical protein